MNRDVEESRRKRSRDNNQHYGCFKCPGFKDQLRSSLIIVKEERERDRETQAESDIEREERSLLH